MYLNRNGKNRILNFFKSVKNDSRLFRILITCLVLVVVCFCACGYHVKQITNLYTNILHSDVSVALDMTQNALDRDFTAKGNYLEAVATNLEKYENPDKHAIFAALSVANETDVFDNLYFVKKANSVLYKSDGYAVSVVASKYEQMIGDTDGSVAIFRSINSEAHEDMAFGICVKYEGVVTGYLIGAESASKILNDAYPGVESIDTQVVLFDKGGSIISHADNDSARDVRSENFYAEYLMKLSDDEYVAAQIAEQMQLADYSSSVNTVSASTADSDELQILYTPIGDSNWTVAANLSKRSITKAILPMLAETLFTVACLIVVVLFMIVIIGRYASVEQDRIHDLTFVDTLTDAPNETAFKLQAEKLIRENPDSPYMVASFDIVNFRYINESYGHDKADVILKALSKAMYESLTLKETFARVGADRFVSLVLDDGREDECVAFVSRRIADATSYLLMNYPVKIKAGIYYVTDRDEPIADMMDKANLARKAVSADLRSNGNVLRNEYHESLSEEMRKQEQIESCMDMALCNREFVPFLQPKWDMEKDHICGAEALVRWRRSDGSLVPPGEFIPLFEKNGFIERIDFFMLESICAYLRKMIDENRAVYPVSINQSRFLMYNPEYINKVQEILLKYKIPKGLVELELTETVFFHEKERMLEVMRRLKDYNVNLSIDDFGSGYSSLNLLRDIPFDVLKIDRGFLDESSQSESGKWILRKIVEMAEGLNLKVICEGVETREHVDMLLGIGCKFAQGFLYSKPIPIEDFIDRYNAVNE